MVKRISYILFFVAFIAINGFCATIHVECPLRVSVGEQFQLRYTVGTSDVKGFRIGGNVPDGLEVLMGPSTSTQQSFSMVNGHTSQSSSVTYTYILMATRNGTFVIPAARATVNGSTAVSKALKISVSGRAQSGGGGSQHRQQPGQRVDRMGSAITGKDLFLKVSANKTKVYEQEPILLTYKVYTLVNLTQLEGKMPDLQGFHTQEIPLPQQKQFHIERVNGRPYNCVTWSEYVMFPQMTGKMTIPSITFKGIVAQENPNVDDFEAFFNGGSNYVEVQKDITAPSVNVEVLPLPAKPANFSGGVGKFSITSSVDKKTVKAGDPVNIRFVVSGTGNMKLIKQPEMTLPSDFDKYDAKVTDKTKLTVDGVTGSMIYDILIVPRNKGHYSIPSTQFVYFDTQENKYKTLTTQSFELEVEKGDGKSAVSDFTKNDTDIHDILSGESNVQNIDDTFFGGKTYLSVNALVLVVFIVLLVIFRKRAMELADVVAMRGKKANKVASKRLRKAAKLLSTGKTGEFYDEVMRALWGYVGDKLAMPVEQLSRENISDNLSQRHIEESVIRSFIEAIDECDYARYAPGDTMVNMHTTYDKAESAITNIDTAMKRSHKTKNHITSMLLFLMLTLSMSAGASDFTRANADAAYKTGDYNKAVLLYEKCQPSAETYCNKGNAYFRMGNYPQAMLSYCKAHKLAPGNSDVNHNIEICATKTVDKLPVERDVFFVQWYKALLCSMTVDAWATTALVSLIVALILFLVYLFVDNNVTRHVSFYGSVALIILFLLGNLFAWQQKKALTGHDAGVVMVNTLNVKSSPTTSSPCAFTIHEGTVVDINDTDMKGWLGISLSDGREGWVKTNTISAI